MNEPETPSEPAPPGGVTPAKAEEVPAAQTQTPTELTKEEQWALFEKDLKENDWGHQPC